MTFLAAARATLLALAAASPAAAQDFHEVAAPAAPDYSLSSSWAATADAPGMSVIVPRGSSPEAIAPQVDVFFIHPTTFRSREGWNQDLSDEMTNAWTDVSSIARQASVFNGCCRVFAPRYRQASFLDRNGGREHALALAYQDIEAAFDHFLLHHSNGRPFIIAGHSQGGFLTAQLLERKVSGTPLAARLVAAYSIGMAVTHSEAEARFPDIPVCASAAQTGCLLQWNAVLHDADIDAAADMSENYALARYPQLERSPPICVNPISFVADGGLTQPDQSLGAVAGKPGEAPVLPIEAGKVTAGCQRGMLAVSVDDSLALAPLPGGSMHYHDFGLFYEDVRRNAISRVEAYLRDRSTGQH
jgi:pimeloyl-ACP methyl ester carboxylesterase